MAARTSSTWPWLAVGVTLLAALLTASGTASAWATASRTAAGGFGWQAWTTHCVHVSAAHLLGSGLVWLVAGAAVERLSRGSLVVVVVAGAPAITGIALVMEPGMGSYAGLSGLACACVVWLACAWFSDKRTRLLGSILWVAVGVRIACDLSGNGHGWGLALNEATAGDPVRVARYAHLAGAIVGALVRLGYLRSLRASLSARPPSTVAMNQR